jgi:hypothetical protein
MAGKYIDKKRKMFGQMQKSVSPKNNWWSWCERFDEANFCYCYEKSILHEQKGYPMVPTYLACSLQQL